MVSLLDIQKRVSDYMDAHHMIESGDYVVAGVSGGADSMCMLNILIELKKGLDYGLTVVHVHHGIRGQEADRDMAYVEEFCRVNNIDCVTVKYDIPAIAKENHQSCEEAGRIKRYEAFAGTLEKRMDAGQYSRGRIAVAHNLNDSSETFLFNLFRGTGLTGLSGIQPVRDNVVRPVLCLSREEILVYLREKNIAYCVDGTNNETDYTRNKIRLELMPYITENINVNAMGNIGRTASMLDDINIYINRQAVAAEDGNVSFDNEKKVCRLSQRLWKQDKIIVTVVIRNALKQLAGKLKDITAGHVNSVWALGENKVSKSVDLPYNICAVKTYDGVEIKFRKEISGNDKDKTELLFNLENILNNGGTIAAGKCILQTELIDVRDVDLSENKYTKFLDYDILKGNLELRNRKPGDYLVIDSLGQRKKIKDLFIDMKIPKAKRNEILLLARGSEVVWIIGSRIGENYKITSETTKAIRLDWRNYYE